MPVWSFGHYVGIYPDPIHIFLEVTPPHIEVTISTPGSSAPSELHAPSSRHVGTSGFLVSLVQAAGGQTHLSFTNAALLLLHHAGCGTPSGSIKSSKLHWGVADKIARRPIVRRRFAYKRLLRRVPRICTFGGMMKAGLNCDGMQQRLCESYGEALKWE